MGPKLTEVLKAEVVILSYCISKSPVIFCPVGYRSSETESGVEALRGVGVCAIAVEYLIKYADLIFSNRLQTSSLLTRSGKHIPPELCLA
jgi:hypothetical protein